MAAIPFADIMNAACADPKHAILFADRLFDDRAKRSMAAQLRAMLRSSHRFYIEDEVVQAACRLGIQHPKVLFEMLQRARAPFQKIWLEWSLDAQLKEAGRQPEPDAPLRCGCFVERLSESEPVYRMTQVGGPPRNIDWQSVALSPISILYNLRTPFDESNAEHDLIVKHSELPSEFVRMTLLGSAYSAIEPDEADADEIEERQNYCDALAKHATYMFNPMTRSLVQASLERDSKATRASLAFTIQETSGQWRLALALLALMNAQEYVERGTYRVGHNRTVRTTVVPYLEHITVKLKLPRQIVQDRLVREYVEAIPRRRHEVMGHWRHSRKRGNPNCDHAMVDVTPTRQRCALCDFSQWWVNEHERGDASRGYVTKDRLVARS